MRDEQSRPGWFDADGEIADGGEPRRGRGLAQGQRRGRYGVKDDRAVAIVITNLESELDNGEARARQRLLGGIDRNDRQPPGASPGSVTGWSTGVGWSGGSSAPGSGSSGDG